MSGQPSSVALWQVEVGEGYSSPVLSAGRVFIFSREGGEEVVRALDLEDGSTIWRSSYAAPYRMNRAAASHGSGPKSTPHSCRRQGMHAGYFRRALMFRM